MKVTRHRKARALRHKIHMPDGIWTYQIGRGGATIRNPDCELTGKINLSELTGWTWDELERSAWKRSGHPQVKPSDIRSFIEKIKKGEYKIVTTSIPKKKRIQVAQRQRSTAQNRINESNPSLGH